METVHLAVGHQARSSLLSTRSASRTGEQCSANHYFIKRSELILSLKDERG
jgi:hypothetical protein